jgi:hypothetical protein
MSETESTQIKSIFATQKKVELSAECVMTTAAFSIETTLATTDQKRGAERSNQEAQTQARQDWYDVPARQCLENSIRSY